MSPTEPLLATLPSRSLATDVARALGCRQRLSCRLLGIVALPNCLPSTRSNSRTDGKPNKRVCEAPGGLPNGVSGCCHRIHDASASKSFYSTAVPGTWHAPPTPPTSRQCDARLPRCLLSKFVQLTGTVILVFWHVIDKTSRSSGDQRIS